MTARCANCGLPSHRYGTGDRNHKPDKTACINGLRHELRKLTATLQAALDELDGIDLPAPPPRQPDRQLIGYLEQPNEGPR